MKSYYSLAKPGIVFGNAITAAGGFFLASRGHIDFCLFLAMLTGLSFIIASACVFNNCIDRKMDKKMKRTQYRALATGKISVQKALVLGIVLGLVGILILSLYTNRLATLAALGGFFVYVALYSFLKYKTVYGTIIGSVAGAVPPVVGYAAASAHLDTAALLLFIILVLWQMPHFFALALHRLEDYAAAGIPVLPVKKGIHATKVHMLLYTIAFLVAALMLTALGYTGYVYLAAMALLGLGWICLCIQGFKTNNDKLWARKMFQFSLVVIMAFSLMISLDSLLTLQASFW